MPIDAKLAALVAINEALSALDKDCIPVPGMQTDQLVDEARETLLGARGLLTEQPWPMLPHPLDDKIAFEAWVTARAEEQRKDGRL